MKMKNLLVFGIVSMLLLTSGLQAKQSIMIIMHGNGVITNGKILAHLI